MISKHNKKLLHIEEDLHPCNCQSNTCPVEGSCQTTGVVNTATVPTENSAVFKFIWLNEGTFKESFIKHNNNFKTRNPQNNTKLSEKTGELQDREENLKIRLEIYQRSKPYKPGSEDCQLCITEIYHIIFQPEESDLHSWNVFMNKCTY